MNIGEVAIVSGLPAKTIRYYEDIGLVKPLRDTNGYRAFRTRDAHKLTDVRKLLPDVPLRGGVRFDGWSVVVKHEVFPDLFAWNPIWSTRIKGLSIKLPATLLREKVIPERFKGAWELLVTFVWTMIVAAILARA